MKVLVTGGTGFVGRHLALALGERARLTSRRPGVQSPLEVVAWNPEHIPDVEVFSGIDAVIHLAGESVAASRWTRERKEAIVSSRTVGTSNLVAGMARLAKPPRVFVCASAVGFYGDRGDETLTEDSPSGNDFLAQVCSAWEAEAVCAEVLGTRVVRARFGLILGPDGGAMSRLVPVIRSGLGGTLGNGQQWWPWVHISDVVGALTFLLEKESVKGPVNVVGPHPLRQREFIREMGRSLGRPAWVPAPRLALRAVLGEMSSMLLASQRAVPKALEIAGFEFQYPGLKEALASLH